jgi:hypothetical protein
MGRLLQQEANCVLLRKTGLTLYSLWEYIEKTVYSFLIHCTTVMQNVTWMFEVYSISNKSNLKTPFKIFKNEFHLYVNYIVITALMYMYNGMRQTV